MKVSQIGTSTIIALLAIASFVLWQQTAESILAFLVLGIVLPSFYKLDIQVTDQYISFRMGIGLIRQRIPLSQVTHAIAVKNPVWTGWGVRFRPGFTLYNVAGFNAVELTIAGKQRKIRLGTDVPEKLSRYINQQIQG